MKRLKCKFKGCRETYPNCVFVTLIHSKKLRSPLVHSVVHEHLGPCLPEKYGKDAISHEELPKTKKSVRRVKRVPSEK